MQNRYVECCYPSKNKSRYCGFSFTNTCLLRAALRHIGALGNFFCHSLSAPDLHFIILFIVKRSKLKRCRSSKSKCNQNQKLMTKKKGLQLLCIFGLILSGQSKNGKLTIVRIDLKCGTCLK